MSTSSTPSGPGRGTSPRESTPDNTIIRGTFPYDVILAGVGGQGVLSVSAIVATSALKEGLLVKCSEVHGMAQRGGCVQSNLRISDAPIHSDIIPRGSADLILGMEPVESLRYLPFLAWTGMLLTSADPVVNIPDYPDIQKILDAVLSLPRAALVRTGELARKLSAPKAGNVIMVGAASRFLPIPTSTIESTIAEMFARKGDRVVEANLRAFRAGREAVS